MRLLKNIIYHIFSLQEKFLRFKLDRTLGAKNLSKRKKFFQEGCILSLDSLAEEEKNKMEEELGLILKNADYEPEKLLEYVKNQGTSVYYTDTPKALYSIGENEGFIYPQKGAKALYIASLAGLGLKLTNSISFTIFTTGTLLSTGFPAWIRNQLTF